MKRNSISQSVCHLYVHLTILFLFKICSGLAQQIPFQLQEQMWQANVQKHNLKPHQKKISSTVYDLIQQFNSNKNSKEHENIRKLISQSLIDIDETSRIHLMLRTNEISSSLLEQLATLGFEVEATTANLPITPNHHMITGWTSLSSIEKIAQLGSIFHIRQADKPLTQAGEVMTEGDAILRANLVRTNFGITGLGQKVGVLSNGCAHLANSRSSGDLPASVHVINNRFTGDAGTAMLEIIYDLAPGVALAFADQGNSQADFANNIKLLQQAGCTIICDDLLYPLEPVYEDGVIAQTIDDMVNNHNIVYISAAGDQQRDHYEGDFYDPDGDNWHNFTQDDETITAQLEAKSTITVVLQWNNQFGRSGDDYDLYIYNEKFTAILASSQNTQDGNDDPIETVSYTNTNPMSVTVHMALQKFAGAGRNLSLYTFGAGVTPKEYVGPGGAIYGHAGAKKCLAVAAIDVNDPGHDTVEPFSSHGPTRIYSYDARGNPTGFYDRDKPDHSAMDGVQTKVGQSGFFSNPFYGTSAAAAHSAGVAALMRQAAPNWSPIQILETLNNQCIDLYTPGVDYVSGHGRIDAYEAVNYVVQGAPEITVTPDSFSITLLRGNTSTELMRIGNVGGSNLQFNLSSHSSSLSGLFMAPGETDVVRRVTKALSDPGDKILDKKPFKSARNKSARPLFQKPFTSISAINDEHLLLYENFEAGITPPVAWSKLDGPSSPGGNFSAHWTIDQGYVFSGNYGAVCYWGYNLNEWLITPELDFSSIKSPALSFWWLSSYYWHVAPNDNGDLFIKVSTDGGTNWQTIWTFGNIGVWEDFVWYYSIIDLSAYEGYPGVKIAFNVVANNNADIALDEVMVLGEDVRLGWLQINPTSGTIAPGGTQNINLLFSTIVDGDTLSIGDYSGNLTISSNDPDHPIHRVPVTLHVTELFNISGQLKYYLNPSVPIQNATVKLTGDGSHRSISNANGYFEFLKLTAKNYTVLPEKNDELRDAITPYDAALILRHLAGTLPLSCYQKIAADVSGDKQVTNTDVSLILKYYVGLIPSFPIGAEWTFVPHDYAINDTNWSIAPRSRNYWPLNSDHTNQDFWGILYGDVSGNWARRPEQRSAEIAEFNIHRLSATLAGKLQMPVTIQAVDSIRSGSFKIRFTGSNLKFSSGFVDSSSNDMLVLVSQGDHEINVAFAAARPIHWEKLTFHFQFDPVKPEQLTQPDFDLSEIIFDDQPAMVTVVSNISTDYPVPREWELSQNYPNPFNNATAFGFAVPEVSKITIEIVNLLGQHIKTVIDGIKEPGRYQVTWSGLDDQGQPVGSGIYLYRIQAGNYSACRKMVVVR